MASDLAKLSIALDGQIPTKSATKLLIDTGNVRAFDRFAPAWRSTKGDSPIRDRSNVAAIAEIVRRLDVMAIQGVRTGAQAFVTMMHDLGDHWAFMVTDVTTDRSGNNERLAFVYDTTRLQPSGLGMGTRRVRSVSDHRRHR